MKAKVKLLAVKTLLAHEQTDPVHLANLMGRIVADGLLKNPVVVDKKTRVILDGHHRVTVVKKLKLKFMPVMLVDYFNPQNRVFFRRADFKVKLIKTAILNRGLAGRPFPNKTTRNWIKGRIRGVNIRLDKLT